MVLQRVIGLSLLFVVLNASNVLAADLAADFAAEPAAEPAAEAAASPEAVIEKATDELLSLIEQSRGYVKEDPERFFVKVEALLRPVVDFKGFARSVMAAHYKGASVEQRERFADAFKWGLVRSYALMLGELDDGEIALVASQRPQRSPRRKNVKMEIRFSNGEVYPIVYSMALGKDEAWRMRNIIINGVNIGLTYRSQFSSAAQDVKYGGSLDAVIDSWANLLASDERDESDDRDRATDKGDEVDGVQADAVSATAEAS
ncbi:MAG: ABC transporter substrate-binding protein [Gammaproteobacteria bacterium]|nr:ABC transporter substrate-binding protein [Gammaproteobacteria bacterium]